MLHRDPSEVAKELGQELSPYYLKKSEGKAGESPFLYVKHNTLEALCNDIFGTDNWRQEAKNYQKVHSSKKDDEFHVLCSCFVRITVGNGPDSTFREDIGYGQAISTTEEEAEKKAQLYAARNGFTRCSRLFGEALGNSLTPAYAAFVGENLSDEFQ